MMAEIIIDCGHIYSREDLHSLFQDALVFPQWYGGNLDALHDCLTSVSGTVRLLNWDAAEIRLGIYGKKAQQVLLAAARHNPKLELDI